MQPEQRCRCLNEDSRKDRLGKGTGPGGERGRFSDMGQFELISSDILYLKAPGGGLPGLKDNRDLTW